MIPLIKALLIRLRPWCVTHQPEKPLLTVPQPDLAPDHVKIDEFEQKLVQFKQINMEVKHRFTPHLYIREIYMPAGTLCTSKIHKYEHPFVISKGSVSVWIPGEKPERLTAPHTGITKPGTRRVLYVHEDTIWTTFHPTEQRELEKIEAEIIEPRHNHLGLTSEELKELKITQHCVSAVELEG